ncbi:Ldh family oxidoreductase [Paraburkholderia fynbosensis]|uniref:Putative oxidoreductase YjmC n=1 Tax=Paraburkholderia fynbosensis TaxID=1200993 RepID=A0A6J5H307_9BURK|nr:Ldh family oxidoreductase [Paraburkholderia fynbosensis]CAB3809743.1 putative oxidoreductase YjmC [Paraburkholderia fynbosensis]
MDKMDGKFSYAGLVGSAIAILEKAGLGNEAATIVSEGLVEADLYGHTTHGLALLAKYVDELESGSMRSQDEPEVVADAGAMSVWDGKRLPGVWTTHLAVSEACRKAARFGCGGVVVRNSHHIASLAVFLEKPARDGKLVLVLSSDPASAHVAPFGGTSPVLTPNPIAAGIPASVDPVLIDISTSITTAAQVERARANNGRLPGNWLVDVHGHASDDPAAVREGGALLPIGGLDHGHKGYGMSILVEALTQGLAGHGRADKPTGWGASVTALAFDPARLAGGPAFNRQSDALINACRSAAVPPEAAAVRMPGEAALSRKKAALSTGIKLDSKVVDSLLALSERFGVPL